MSVRCLVLLHVLRAGAGDQAAKNASVDFVAPSASGKREKVAIFFSRRFLDCSSVACFTVHCVWVVCATTNPFLPGAQS